MISRAVALPILFTAAAMAYSSPLGTAVYCVMLAGLCLISGPRFKADRLAQAGVNVGAMMGGVLVARLTSVPIETPETLSEGTLLLGLPMLSIAAARACLHRPLYGDKLTLLATLVALTAAGRAQTGPVFPALAAMTLVSGLYAFRASDETRAPLRHLEARHYAGAMFGLAMAGALAIFATWTLPRIHDAMLARLMQSRRNETGFSNIMSLSAMDEMFQNESVVLRVRGGRPQLLRGLVLSAYQNGRWEVSNDGMAFEVVETQMDPSEPGLIEIEHAGRPRNYFLPLGAEGVVASSGVYNRFVAGTAAPSHGLLAKRLWFRVGDPPKLPKPTLADLHVSTRIASQLASMVQEWGAAGLPPREALQVIQDKLKTDYKYSLSFERTPHVDPVLDFLRTHKEGHCEYFASALALLARSAKIPTRVAAGYRVSEESPFGYAIVRQRDAHSWVEVWIDDHWETYDPTPASDLDTGARATTPWISALFDGMRTGWEAVDDWIGRRTAFELSLALAGLIGALVMVRTLRNRQKTVRAEGFDIPSEFAMLAESLTRVGVKHGPHETLGTLAARVAGAEQLEEDVRAEIHRALERYERYRYGTEGDAGEALVGLKRAAARLR